MPIVRLPVPGEVLVAMLAETEVPLPAGDSAQIGTSTYAARADHIHPKQEIDISDKLSITNPQPLGTANPGMSLLAAREDHVHPNNLSDIVPQGPGTASPGTSNEISRADHVHPKQSINLETAAAPVKITPIGTDLLPLTDSAASYSLKQISFDSLNAYFNIRPRLGAQLNLYVRTDGNDNNNGLTNTSGGAFLTIQRAINVAYSYDLNGFNITINIAAGTYTQALTFPSVKTGTGNVILLGNTSSPSTVVVTSNTSSPPIYADVHSMALIRGVRISNTGGGYGIVIWIDGYVDVASVEFGSVGSTAGHVIARGGSFAASGNYSIVGGGGNHWQADTGGKILVQSRTITLTGTPNFTGQFAFADCGSSMLLNGNTFSGSATGPKYYAQGAGAIQTYTGNVNYLPGNVAGSLGTGGYYG